jgi:glycosyltransferase involved in cell wall biosynthesis
MRPRVLLTVSGVIPATLSHEIDAGARPRADYRELAAALGADHVEYSAARRRAGAAGRVSERLVGPQLLLAWACFRDRNRYDVIVTDGEQIGLPFAILLWFAALGGGRRPRHDMIVHRLSVPKKAWLFRLFGLGRFVDTMFVYASAQKAFIERALRVKPSRVVLTSFMADTVFFAPAEHLGESERAVPTICAAGLEYRDYDTLIRAVRGLDVHVVIAAASPWSKRANTTEGRELPPNVEVCSLGFADLRQLYADSSFVVMPLHDVDFQAGVTTVLEAMAMGKAVICSHTTGQTDVIIDGETGIYVPAGDRAALRKAIVALLDDPVRAKAIGKAARAGVEREADVAAYAPRLAAHVHAERAA